MESLPAIESVKNYAVLCSNPSFERLQIISCSCSCSYSCSCSLSPFSLHCPYVIRLNFSPFAPSCSDHSHSLSVELEKASLLSHLNVAFGPEILAIKQPHLSFHVKMTFDTKQSLQSEPLLVDATHLATDMPSVRIPIFRRLQSKVIVQLKYSIPDIENSLKLPVLSLFVSFSGLHEPASSSRLSLIDSRSKLSQGELALLVATAINESDSSGCLAALRLAVQYRHFEGFFTEMIRQVGGLQLLQRSLWLEYDCQSHEMVRKIIDHAFSRAGMYKNFCTQVRHQLMNLVTVPKDLTEFLLPASLQSIETALDLIETHLLAKDAPHRSQDLKFFLQQGTKVIDLCLQLSDGLSQCSDLHPWTSSLFDKNPTSPNKFTFTDNLFAANNTHLLVPLKGHKQEGDQEQRHHLLYSHFFSPHFPFRLESHFHRFSLCRSNGFSMEIKEIDPDPKNSFFCVYQVLHFFLERPARGSSTAFTEDSSILSSHYLDSQLTVDVEFLGVPIEKQRSYDLICLESFTDVKADVIMTIYTQRKTLIKSIRVSLSAPSVFCIEEISRKLDICDLGIGLFVVPHLPIPAKPPAIDLLQSVSNRKSKILREILISGSEPQLPLLESYSLFEHLGRKMEGCVLTPQYASQSAFICARVTSYNLIADRALQLFLLTIDQPPIGKKNDGSYLSFVSLIPPSLRRSHLPFSKNLLQLLYKIDSKMILSGILDSDPDSLVALQKALVGNFDHRDFLTKAFEDLLREMTDRELLNIVDNFLSLAYLLEASQNISDSFFWLLRLMLCPGRGKSNAICQRNISLDLQCSVCYSWIRASFSLDYQATSWFQCLCCPANFNVCPRCIERVHEMHDASHIYVVLKHPKNSAFFVSFAAQDKVDSGGGEPLPIGDEIKARLLRQTFGECCLCSLKITATQSRYQSMTELKKVICEACFTKIMHLPDDKLTNSSFFMFFPSTALENHALSFPSSPNSLLNSVPHFSASQLHHFCNPTDKLEYLRRRSSCPSKEIFITTNPDAAAISRERTLRDSPRSHFHPVQFITVWLLERIQCGCGDQESFALSLQVCLDLITSSPISVAIQFVLESSFVQHLLSRATTKVDSFLGDCLTHIFDSVFDQMLDSPNFYSTYVSFLLDLLQRLYFSNTESLSHENHCYYTVLLAVIRAINQAPKKLERFGLSSPLQGKKTPEKVCLFDSEKIFSLIIQAADFRPGSLGATEIVSHLLLELDLSFLKCNKECSDFSQLYIRHCLFLPEPQCLEFYVTLLPRLVSRLCEISPLRWLRKLVKMVSLRLSEKAAFCHGIIKGMLLFLNCKRRWRKSKKKKRRKGLDAATSTTTLTNVFFTLMYICICIKREKRDQRHFEDTQLLIAKLLDSILLTNKDLQESVFATLGRKESPECFNLEKLLILLLEEDRICKSTQRLLLLCKMLIVHTAESSITRTLRRTWSILDKFEISPQIVDFLEFCMLDPRMVMMLCRESLDLIDLLLGRFNAIFKPENFLSMEDSAKPIKPSLVEISEVDCKKRYVNILLEFRRPVLIEQIFLPLEDDASQESGQVLVYSGPHKHNQSLIRCTSLIQMDCLGKVAISISSPMYSSQYLISLTIQGLEHLKKNYSQISVFGKDNQDYTNRFINEQYSRLLHALFRSPIFDTKVFTSNSVRSIKVKREICCLLQGLATTDWNIHIEKTSLILFHRMSPKICSLMMRNFFDERSLPHYLEFVISQLSQGPLQDIEFTTFKQMLELLAARICAVQQSKHLCKTYSDILRTVVHNIECQKYRERDPSEFCCRKNSAEVEDFRGTRDRIESLPLQEPKKVIQWEGLQLLNANFFSSVFSKTESSIVTTRSIHKSNFDSLLSMIQIEKFLLFHQLILISNLTGSMSAEQQLATFRRAWFERSLMRTVVDFFAADDREDPLLNPKHLFHVLFFEENEDALEFVNRDQTVQSLLSQHKKKALRVILKNETLKRCFTHTRSSNELVILLIDYLEESGRSRGKTVSRNSAANSLSESGPTSMKNKVQKNSGISKVLLRLLFCDQEEELHTSFLQKTLFEKIPKIVSNRVELLKILSDLSFKENKTTLKIEVDHVRQLEHLIDDYFQHSLRPLMEKRSSRPQEKEILVRSIDDYLFVLKSRFDNDSHLKCNFFYQSDIHSPAAALTVASPSDTAILTELSKFPAETMIKVEKKGSIFHISQGAKEPIILSTKKVETYDFQYSLSQNMALIEIHRKIPCFQESQCTIDPNHPSLLSRLSSKYLHMGSSAIVIKLSRSCTAFEHAIQVLNVNRRINHTEYRGADTVKVAESRRFSRNPNTNELNLGRKMMARTTIDISYRTTWMSQKAPVYELLRNQNSSCNVALMTLFFKNQSLFSEILSAGDFSPSLPSTVDTTTTLLYRWKIAIILLDPLQLHSFIPPFPPESSSRNAVLLCHPEKGPIDSLPPDVRSSIAKLVQLVINSSLEITEDCKASQESFAIMLSSLKALFCFRSSFPDKCLSSAQLSLSSEKSTTAAVTLRRGSQFVVGYVESILSSALIQRSIQKEASSIHEKSSTMLLDFLWFVCKSYIDAFIQNMKDAKENQISQKEEDAVISDSVKVALIEPLIFAGLQGGTIATKLSREYEIFLSKVIQLWNLKQTQFAELKNEQDSFSSMLLSDRFSDLCRAFQRRDGPVSFDFSLLEDDSLFKQSCLAHSAMSLLKTDVAASIRAFHTILQFVSSLRDQSSSPYDQHALKKSLHSFTSDLSTDLLECDLIQFSLSSREGTENTPDDCGFRENKGMSAEEDKDESDSDGQQPLGRGKEADDEAERHADCLFFSVSHAHHGTFPLLSTFHLAAITEICQQTLVSPTIMTYLPTYSVVGILGLQFFVIERVLTFLADHSALTPFRILFDCHNPQLFVVKSKVGCRKYRESFCFVPNGFPYKPLVHFTIELEGGDKVTPREPAQIDSVEDFLAFALEDARGRSSDPK